MEDKTLEWLKKLIGYKNIKAFYNNSLWINKRTEILKRDNYECQKCKDKGRYSKGECVHHKQHVKRAPHLALDDSNLITLCNSCHDEEHPEKLRNEPKPQLNEERW